MPYAVRRWRDVLAVAATMVLGTGMTLAKPWPMKIVVDVVLSQKPMPKELAGAAYWLPGSAQPEGLLLWCCCAILVIYLLAWGLRLATSVADTALGQRMVFDLALDLFDHLQRLTLRFHGRQAVGDSIRRITADCNCIATIVRDALLPVAPSIVSLLAMFAVMWQLDPTLTYLALAAVPFMIVVFRRHAGPMLERGYEQDVIEGRLYSVTEQTLSAIPVVQSYGREEHEDRRFVSVTGDLIMANLATTHAQLWFRILMGLATAGGTAAILWVGASHVLAGRLAVGSILVFVSYVGALYSPIESLMYTAATIQASAGGARRVFEILELAPEVADRPAARTVPTVRGHLRLEHVDFGYEPGRPVLHDVCLELRPGEVVALVGPTGSGKSTILGLFPRFFDPWSGRVTLDGHDIRDLKLSSLRRQVALVLQEPLLFPDSIAENIAVGRLGASLGEIEWAARAAGAHEFIVRLPQGYDTIVGERGATLSGGERQRLTLARALLRDAPILLLDEPTSALDLDTERLVMSAVREHAAGRTTLVIAHRLTTIQWADRVVVLHDGRIAASETQRELVHASRSEGPFSGAAVRAGSTDGDLH